MDIKRDGIAKHTPKKAMYSESRKHGKQFTTRAFQTDLCSVVRQDSRYKLFPKLKKKARRSPEVEGEGRHRQRLALGLPWCWWSCFWAQSQGLHTQSTGYFCRWFQSQRWFPRSQRPQGESTCVSETLPVATLSLYHHLSSICKEVFSLGKVAWSPSCEQEGHRCSFPFCPQEIPRSLLAAQ